MESKKRVLFLVNHEIVIYNFRKEIVFSLLENGYDVYISTPLGEKVTKLENAGSHIIETNIDRHGKSPLKDVRLLCQYLKILKLIKPDVVLTYTIKPNIYGGIACRLKRIPYLVNITGLGTAVEKEGILQHITVFLYKFALKRATNVYLQNQENLDFFKKNNIAKNHLKLIQGSGVNLTEYKLLEYPKNKVINFLFAARVMKEKGIEEFLQAAYIIRNKYINTSFHIVGFCEENYQELLEKYEREGIIQYHGLVSDVSSLYKMTSCTVHPSYYPEGISNVLLESAASGRPIITTNRSGCKEVVDDGVNGYVVEARNAMDLVAKIETFLSTSHIEKEKMGIAGRNKVEKEFDRRLIVNEYMDSIERIIRGNS